MIIVQFQCGLGNQLFQYALYKKFESLGVKVYGDLQWYRDIITWTLGRTVRRFELPLLGLTIKEASRFQVVRYAKEGTGSYSLDKLLVRLTDKNKTFYDEGEFGEYKPWILQERNRYLAGYWQSPKYFDDIRDIILKEIHFSYKDETKRNILRDTICVSDDSVSVHMRFGDYLKAPEIYGGICGLDYYQKAMGYMKSKLDHPHFFVFSDDKERAVSLLKNENTEYTLVDCNNGEDSYLDMYMMSLCKHNIIANSSFSWWGAYLNETPGRIVIAPYRWNDRQDSGFLCEHSWIRL